VTSATPRSSATWPAPAGPTLVIDDVLPPWRPRGVEVRGQAEAVTEPQPLIRIHPQRIISWGLDPARPDRQARQVASK
jgi:pyridoxamine 5'-phosphate oxidase family protein